MPYYSKTPQAKRIRIIPISLSRLKEYKVYSYFRQYWKDSRLARKLNDTITLKGGDIDNIWVPDPFCYNARESNMMMPNEEIHSFVQVRPNGDIAMSKGWVRRQLACWTVFHPGNLSLLKGETSKSYLSEAICLLKESAREHHANWRNWHFRGKYDPKPL